MKTHIAAALLALMATTAHADTAGLRLTELNLVHHDKAAPMAIWYPGTGSDAPILYADTPVFEGVTAHVGDPVKDGLHPVVLFSHGMGGTDRAQAWLGAALAERGAISVLVNHPGTTWGDFDMSKGVAHWTRTADLSAALDALLADPAFAGRIDLSRVMAAGFSYGGWTALSLGGVRGNHAGFVAACEAMPEMEACDLFLSGQGDVRGVDPSLWNASYADERVTHVTAIDPGLIWGLEPSNLKGLAASTLVIGLGGEEDRMLATDFDRSGLSALLDEAQFVRLEPAYHFTAMPVCKPAGAAILAEDKDDPVCTGPAGTDRAATHAAIVDLMATALGL